MAQRSMPDADKLREKYPSNSVSKISQQNNDIPSKIERKEVRQVATAKARKQGLVKKLFKSIVEDNIEEAKERAFTEVIRPGLKNLLYDTGRDILETVLYGADGGEYRSDRRRSERSRNKDRTSYSKYYEEGRRRDYRASERDDRPYDPDDIILDTRAEAREALDELDFIIRKYGQASILDLYDIVGLTGSWTDKKYGWTSLRGASMKPVRDGVMLIMPRTHLLDD